MYNLAMRIFDVFILAFQGYCLQYFFGSFLEGRLQNPKWNGLLAAVLYAGVKFAAGFFLVSEYKSIQILVKQALLFCALLALVLCCYKAFHGITVFLVVTFRAVNEISTFLGLVVAQMGEGVVSIWNWCLEEGYITSADAFLRIIRITVIVIQISLDVSVSLMFYFCLKKIVRCFTEKDYQMQKTELLFILTPGLVSLLICTLLRIIMITVEDDMPKMLYDRYPALSVIVPAILCLSLLSILFGIKLFQGMISLNREKNSRVILEKQISSMQEHIREMERVQSGVRSVRHDMKNTLSVIMQLAGGSTANQEESCLENEELNSYLSELSDSIDSLELKFKTGNAIADTLLNMKYHEITRDIPGLQINLENFILPDILYVHSYDFGVILGNALDNAMEACRKLKRADEEAKAFVRLTSFQKGELLFLKVENSFDGKLLQNPQAEFPLTDKKDKGIHGIGLANIKNTVEKYDGAVDWKIDDKVFILSVMLKNGKENQRIGNNC